MAFYPTPFGHVEIRVDTRPPRRRKAQVWRRK
jgi:hypothetical protein